MSSVIVCPHPPPARYSQIKATFTCIDTVCGTRYRHTELFSFICLYAHGLRSAEWPIAACSNLYLTGKIALLYRAILQMEIINSLSRNFRPGFQDPESLWWNFYFSPNMMKMFYSLVI